MPAGEIVAHAAKQLVPLAPANRLARLERILYWHKPEYC